MSYTTIHKTARERTVDAGPAIKFLRKLEWEMGHGQCPECCGHDPDNRGWQSQSSHLGHRRSCKLAKALAALGQPVEWRRVNRSPALKAREAWWREVAETAMGAGGRKATLTYKGLKFDLDTPEEGVRASPAPTQAQGTASPSTRPGKAPGRGSSKRGSTRTR